MTFLNIALAPRTLLGRTRYELLARGFLSLLDILVRPTPHQNTHPTYVTASTYR
jgi:hypothetical protein